MPLRLLPLLLAVVLSACMAREAASPRDPVAAPLPAGVSPLTLEQDEFIRG